MIAMKWREALKFFLLLISLILFTFFFKNIKPYLYQFTATHISWDSKYDLAELLMQHLSIVIQAGLLSTVLGLSLGIFCLSAYGIHLKRVLEKITYLGQMIPSLALLSFMLPFLGYGMKPAIVALVIYGIMPVFVSTISGITSVSHDLIEVAESMGMNNREILYKVQVPIASPAILSGIRTSLIINVSAATLASIVGGGGLGILLFLGMKSNNVISMVEGTVPICLLALMIDHGLKMVEDFMMSDNM